MYSPTTAQIARRSDIVSVHELNLEGSPDREVLLAAARENRCVVTDNHRDFAPLTLTFYEQSLPHTGAVFVPGDVGHNQDSRLARAIVRFATDNPDGLQPYEIRWLPI
jgi:predicted nuclease of predicted toxin-antitoxin system